MNSEFIREKRFCSFFLLIFLCSFLSGCSTPKPIRYDPNPPEAGAVPLPLKVAVVELEDRNLAGYEYPLFGCPSMIPGVFYYTCKVKYHPTAFGKCLAKDLNRGKVYESVDYYQNWEEISTAYDKYDLIISGKLNHDRFEEREHFYGLSLPGDILWFVGFPANTTSREVSFEINAFKPDEPRTNLMAEKISFDESDAMTLIFYHYDRHTSYMRHADYRPQYPMDDFCTTEYLQPQYLALRKNLRDLQLHDSSVAKTDPNRTLEK